MPRSHIWRSASLGALFAACAAPSAMASFLDTDFWCRTYGCAVVHDGDTYDIYDNYNFATQRCCIPVGGRMRDYYIRAGTPNITGTTDRITTPDADQGMMLEIVNGGTRQATINDANDDGFLDAGDVMTPFTLNPNTDIQLAGSSKRYSHSFFISSRNTRFSLRALASIRNATGDFADTINLSDIKLTPAYVARGNDDGFDFGARANAGNITIVNGVDDLGDLAAGPTQIMYFGNPIRRGFADIDEQSIRLDFLYEMPDYDFSMGIGSVDIDVEFEFYREN